MRMTKRYGMLLVLAVSMALNMAGQQQFTLEDLNFGGDNYKNMIPKNRTLAWWGDQLVRLVDDTCWTVDAVKGKEKVLFTREKLNKWAGWDADSLQM